jgi:hypothetical protein
MAKKKKATTSKRQTSEVDDLLAAELEFLLEDT